MKLMPMYWMRAVGGSLYILGMLMFGWNILMTWRRRPATYEEPEIQAAPLERTVPAPVAAPTQGAVGAIHRRALASSLEGLPVTFTIRVVVAVVVASLFEILPTFLIRSNVPTIASVKPLTPLELAGRDLYIREGCFNCHSQMIRPFRHETERYGEHSKPGEFVYDHPFLWGSRRIGPDLAREGGKYPNLWHVRHMLNPRDITPRSIMPAYPGLLASPADFAGIAEARQCDGHARRAVRGPREGGGRAGGARAGAHARGRHRRQWRANRPRRQGDHRAGRVPPASRRGHPSHRCDGGRRADGRALT
jgi:cytochrome c oxidase cbb3-type subunit I/II